MDAIKNIHIGDKLSSLLSIFSCSKHKLAAPPPTIKFPQISTVTMSFKEEKEKYLSMDIEEKRKHYRASNILTLEDIPTWPEYYQKNKDSMTPVTVETHKRHDEELASKISIWVGDITALEIDVIVNAANKTLLGGGGVDGAIHSAAGANLVKECSSLNGCQVGEAKITGGYKLPAKYVIHTVGPQGEKPDKLRECYLNSLETAKNSGLKSIAFPCISTGVYGYPQRPAAEVALKTVIDYLKDHSEIERVIFCLFQLTDREIYKELLQTYFPQV